MTRSHAATTHTLPVARRREKAQRLEELLLRNFARVLVRVRAMLGDGTRRTAESFDHLQDVFVEVLREVEHVDLRDEEQLVRRMAAIARNNIRDAGRRQRERGFESVSISWLDPSGQSARGASPRSRVSQREQVALLARALKRLPPIERQVVELRGLEHLRFCDIAARLDRNEDAVRKMYHRALLVLGRRLTSS